MIYRRTHTKLLAKDYRWLEDVSPRQFIDSLWNWQTKVRFQCWIEKEHCMGRPFAGDGRPSADLEPVAWRAVQGHSGHLI